MLAGFKDLRLTMKVLVATGVLILLVVATNNAVFISLYRGDAQEALVDQAEAFTAVAEAATAHAGSLADRGAFDMQGLRAELQEANAMGMDYQDTTIFDTIPVIVGLSAAKDAAAGEGIDFRVPALEPRNPENNPLADDTSGAFRLAMLQELRTQVQTGSMTPLARVDSEHNRLHVMRPITLGTSCMTCHGDPGHPIGDPDGDGYDPLGFPMEGWSEGDMHGAYEVVMPLEPMDQSVASFVGWGAGLSLIVVGVGGLGFRWVLGQQMTRPLNSTIAQLREISEGDGDLSKRLPEDRKDEIGELARAFNKTMGTIHDMVFNVVGVSREVVEQTGELAASGEATATRLAEGDQAAGQIAAASQQLAATASEVRDRSTQARDHAQTSGAQARDGGEMMQRLVSEVESIAGSVGSATETIERLAERSNDIGMVIEVINEIAEQTNLLALNAAIEAARAGEHGRGFAVVSDEVRKLADRTTNATDEITKLIGAIQSEAGQARERIQVGMESVSAGRQQADEAGRGLSEIVSGVSSVSDSIDSIAAASEQQAAASEEVSSTIATLSSTLSESASTSRELTGALGTLNARSEEMVRALSRFKLRSGG
ncbi:MAG: methyl-accepting chemotaxis protein [Planctomycetota bacterium]